VTASGNLDSGTASAIVRGYGTDKPAGGRQVSLSYNTRPSSTASRIAHPGLFQLNLICCGVTTRMSVGSLLLGSAV